MPRSGPAEPRRPAFETVLAEADAAAADHVAGPNATACRLPHATSDSLAFSGATNLPPSAAKPDAARRYHVALEVSGDADTSTHDARSAVEQILARAYSMSHEELLAARRAIARISHPDVVPAAVRAEAEARMKEANAAIDRHLAAITRRCDPPTTS